MKKTLKENLSVNTFFKSAFLAIRGKGKVSLPEEGLSEVTVPPQHQL